MNRPYISIVIPTLNEEKNIGSLIGKIRREMGGHSYEILVVDGGKSGKSTDNTVTIAKKTGAGVAFDYGGKGSALMKGFALARGEIIISMDADLSHRPKELRLLISGIEAGYDICVGSRFLAGGGSADMPLFRVVGNMFFVFAVNSLYHSDYTDLCYGYRSFSRGALKKLSLKEKGFGIETEINIKAKKSGLRVLEIPSFEKKRKGGEGKLRTFRDGWIILKAIFTNMD